MFRKISAAANKMSMLKVNASMRTKQKNNGLGNFSPN